MPDLVSCNPTFRSHQNDFNSKIACLVHGTCLGQVLALLEHVEGNSERLLLLLYALHTALSAGLLEFATKCSACGTEHADAEVCAHTTHKKHVCLCGHTWVMRERREDNPLAVFATCLLKDQLVFTFPAGGTGHLASPMLGPYFFSNFSTL